MIADDIIEITNALKQKLEEVSKLRK